MSDVRVRDDKFVRKPGKTALDKENGAAASIISNRAERVQWEKQANSVRNNRDFPLHICNGKRSRSLKKR